MESQKVGKQLFTFLLLEGRAEQTDMTTQSVVHGYSSWLPLTVAIYSI
jgi:hypothetical protein